MDLGRARRGEMKCSAEEMDQGNWGGGNTEIGGEAGGRESGWGKEGNVGASLGKKVKGQKQGKKLGFC